MKRFSTLLLSSVLAFGLLFATGCDSTGSTGSTDGQSGTLALRMDGATSKALSTLSTKSTAADSITKALYAALEQRDAGTTDLHASAGLRLRVDRVLGGTADPPPQRSLRAG
jgi:hypothetical protein